MYGGDEKLLREMESRLEVRITTRDGWLRIEGRSVLLLDPDRLTRRAH